MNRTPRTAFTLVELLVVMSIIAILAAMLMPAVNAVREQARRTQCTNNMRNVALALVQHDANRGTLPGRRHNVGTTNSNGNAIRTSWVFPVLPFIERNDIFRAYGPNGNNAGAVPDQHIKILVCPNDGTARSSTNFSFVGNCGQLGDQNPGDINYGVFNHESRKTSLSMISGGDGTAQTLLLSENIDAGAWTSDNEQIVGMCYDTSVPNINVRIGTVTGGERARPSSYHPGGVVVSFCDPHVVFISEDIDRAVWELLFTPNGAAAGQTLILNEEDLGNL